MAATMLVAACSDSGDALLERGAYLVNGPAACGNCHTPQTASGPTPGMELAGGNVFDFPKLFRFAAPNITPDKETGIGGWSEAQIIRAIREGVRPDGRVLRPPMPVEMYRRLSDRDVKAIVVYLLSRKPVKNTVPESRYLIPVPPTWGPPVGKVAEVPRTDKVKYGEYLATAVAHCMECHTTFGRKGPMYETHLGAGGFTFTGSWGVSVAANITPAGIGDYTDAQIRAAITKGVRPDGSKLMPPMPYGYFARIAREDVDAIVAYLRTLKPVE